MVTTSSFTSGAEESAAGDNVRLVDGERLGSVMIESAIGVTEVETDEYALDDPFWKAFETPETDDRIPSEEVPQADSLGIVRTVLRAVESGADHKHEITAYLPARRARSGRRDRPTTTARRGGYWDFSTATYPPTRRDGGEYLDLLDGGDREAARSRLHDAIRGVEVVSRVRAVVREERRVERSRVDEVVSVSTGLSESTARRRAATIARWVDDLPEIAVADGVVEYVS